MVEDEKAVFQLSSQGGFLFYLKKSPANDDETTYEVTTANWLSEESRFARVPNHVNLEFSPNDINREEHLLISSSLSLILYDLCFPTNTDEVDNNKACLKHISIPQARTQYLSQVVNDLKCGNAGIAATFISTMVLESICNDIDEYSDDDKEKIGTIMRHVLVQHETYAAQKLMCTTILNKMIAFVQNASRLSKTILWLFSELSWICFDDGLLFNNAIIYDQMLGLMKYISTSPLSSFKQIIKGFDFSEESTGSDFDEILSLIRLFGGGSKGALFHAKTKKRMTSKANIEEFFFPSSEELENVFRILASVSLTDRFLYLENTEFVCNSQGSMIFGESRNDTTSFFIASPMQDYFMVMVVDKNSKQERDELLQFVEDVSRFLSLN